MGIITDIQPQVKRKNRVSIYIDGVFYCGMDDLTAKENRLNIGDEISEERLMEVQRESETAKAFEQSVKWINRRLRTKKEIREYLRGKGYLSEVIKAVMEKLIEYGFADDYELCRAYVSQYSQRDGKKKIELDLKRLGAEREAIEEALLAIDGQEEACFMVAERYARTHKNLDIRKLKQYLYSKGFSSDDISLAFDKIKEEYEVDGGDEW